MMIIRSIAAAALLLAAPAAAQNMTPGDTWASLQTMPVPVTAGDITDRPYREIGVVLAGVRRATVFSKDASQEKVYRELWERGQKMGADAIVKAQFGEGKIRALSWGSREARGVAIKFLTEAEVSAQKAGAVQP